MKSEVERARRAGRCSEPSSLDECAAILREHAARGERIAFVGGETALDLGNRPSALDAVVSTRRLDRLVEYAPEDQVVVAEAGVTLMTLHNAKGLEFPAVFLVGMEEGLFPLARAMESREELEEERRLFYVGVTRAEDRLFVTHTDRRWRYGNEMRAEPSSFLSELPDGPVQYRSMTLASGKSFPPGEKKGDWFRLLGL